MQNIQILIMLEHWHLISINVIINYDYNCINTMNYQQQTEILGYNIHIEKKIYEKTVNCIYIYVFVRIKTVHVLCSWEPC